ncbi:MAG: hypothetical protein COT74_04565 [Bdellovibrionales bacterium CG10_big_fil_rev_8_21_14_0_10_45_34]|nr:MAG: hypothetical protein COT74_04565 [Bdellovibrionales bacterium CG10_big_fil_rev_8_21_14_0_10_45_34]
MKRTLKTVLLCLSLMAATLSYETVCAQKQKGSSQTSADGGGSARRHFATILYAGLGGAALGLSTLSFYGRPQDYLVNIAYGAAAGVIAGVAYVTYEWLTEPSSVYGELGGAENFWVGRQHNQAPSAAVNLARYQKPEAWGLKLSPLLLSNSSNSWARPSPNESYTSGLAINISM